MRPRSVPIPPAMDMARFAAGIRAGERAVLARAITLIESKRPDHQHQARQLCMHPGLRRPIQENG